MTAVPQPPAEQRGDVAAWLDRLDVDVYATGVLSERDSGGLSGRRTGADPSAGIRTPPGSSWGDSGRFEETGQ